LAGIGWHNCKWLASDQDEPALSIQLVGPPVPVASPPQGCPRPGCRADSGAGGVEQVMQAIEDQLNLDQHVRVRIVVSPGNVTKKIVRSTCEKIACKSACSQQREGSASGVHDPPSAPAPAVAPTRAPAPPPASSNEVRIQTRLNGSHCEGKVSGQDWNLEPISGLIDVKFPAKQVVIDGGSPQQRREAHFLAKAALFQQLRFGDFYCIVLTDAAKLTITANDLDQAKSALEETMDFKGPSTIPCCTPRILKCLQPSQQLQRDAMFRADTRIVIEENDDEGKRQSWAFYRQVGTKGAPSQAWVGSRVWASSRQGRIRQGTRRQGAGTRQQVRVMGPFEYEAREKQRTAAMEAMGNRCFIVWRLVSAVAVVYGLYVAVDNVFGEYVAEATGVAFGYIAANFAIATAVSAAIYFRAGFPTAVTACVAVAVSTCGVVILVAHAARGVPALSISCCSSCSDWKIPESTESANWAVQFSKFCETKASDFGEYIVWSANTKDDGYAKSPFWHYVLAFALEVHTALGWCVLPLFARYVLNKPTVSEWISTRKHYTLTRASKVAHVLLGTVLAVFVISCLIQLGWNVYAVKKSHEMCQQMIKCYNQTMINTPDESVFKCPDFKPRFKWMSEVAAAMSKPSAVGTTTMAAIATAMFGVFQGPIGMLKSALFGWISKLFGTDPLQGLWNLCYGEDRKASDFDDTVTVQLNSWDRTVPKGDGKLKFYTLATLPFSKLFDGKADGGTRDMAVLKRAATKTVSGRRVSVAPLTRNVAHLIGGSAWSSVPTRRAGTRSNSDVVAGNVHSPACVF
jgi:hypothetical protein